MRNDLTFRVECDVLSAAPHLAAREYRAEVHVQGAVVDIVDGVKLCQAMAALAISLAHSTGDLKLEEVRPRQILRRTEDLGRPFVPFAQLEVGHWRILSTI